MAKARQPPPPIVGALEFRLGAWGPIQVKRLFGGHALYRDGTIFGLVFHQRAYFKTDEGNRSDYVDAGMPPFEYTRGDGRTIAMRYYEVPGAVLDDLDELPRWADKALAVTLGHGLQSDIHEAE
jgi:DNA transformation protein and related proteins